MRRRVVATLLVILAVFLGWLALARHRIDAERVTPPTPDKSIQPPSTFGATPTSKAPAESPATPGAPEKAPRVARIERDYADLLNNWRVAASGMSTREQLLAHGRELALLRQSWRADLAGLVSPEELEGFELDVLPAGDAVRRGLAGSTASAAQWRAVFRALEGFDDTFVFGAGATAESLARETARQAADQQIRTALGNERYAFWLKRTNPAFVEIALVVQQQNLPPAAALDVWQVHEELALRQLGGRAQADAPTNQSAGAQAALVQAARVQVEAVIGRDALRRAWNDAFRWLGKKNDSVTAP